MDQTAIWIDSRFIDQSFEIISNRIGRSLSLRRSDHVIRIDKLFGNMKKADSDIVQIGINYT